MEVRGPLGRTTAAAPCAVVDVDPAGAHASSAGVERAWFQRTLAGTTPRFLSYRTYVAADGGEWYDESDATPAKDVYEDYLKACEESR